MPTARSTRPSASPSGFSYRRAARARRALLSLAAAWFWLAPGVSLGDHLPVAVNLRTDSAGGQVLDYSAQAGPYEVAMTCPLTGAGKPARLRIYVRDGRSGTAYQGPARLRLLLQSALRGDREVVPPARLDAKDGLYSTEIQFPSDGSYTAELTILDGTGQGKLARFPIVIGNRGRPAALLGSIAAALVLFLGIVLAARRLKPRP